MEETCVCQAVSGGRLRNLEAEGVGKRLVARKG